MVALFIVLDHFNTSDFDVDSPSYIAIASGRASDVHKPFSNRIFEPYMAMGLSNLTGLSLEQSFRTISIVSFASFVWLLAYMLTRHHVPLIVLSPLLLITTAAQS